MLMLNLCWIKPNTKLHRIGWICLYINFNDRNKKLLIFCYCITVIVFIFMLYNKMKISKLSILNRFLDDLNFQALIGLIRVIPSLMVRMTCSTLGSFLTYWLNSWSFFDLSSSKSYNKAHIELSAKIKSKFD